MTRTVKVVHWRSIPKTIHYNKYIQIW